MIRLVHSNNPDLRQRREWEFNKKVGERLQGWAREAKVSDSKMAEFLKLDSTMIWRIYSGKAPLTCVRAARMCQFVGHNLAELFA